jgi:hypothetical protein
VYTSRSKRFVGYGDADTSVSFLMRGAEMRIAETRAVSRVLRKAYGIGLCSVGGNSYVKEAAGCRTARKEEENIARIGPNTQLPDFPRILAMHDSLASLHMPGRLQRVLTIRHVFFWISVSISIAKANP